MAQTQKKQQDMGTGDVKKLLLQLMIPAVVAQVVNLLYNIVDRIYCLLYTSPSPRDTR